MSRRQRSPRRPAKTRRAKPVQAEALAERLGARGDALCRTPSGESAFVANLLPGERARVSIQGDRGTVIERLTDAPERVAPDCPVAEACGGCALQHMAPEAYRAWKRSLVVEALGREGVEAPVDPLVQAWGEGRRRAGFHAVRAMNGVAFGYRERAGPRVVDTGDCPVATPAIRGSIPALRRLGEVILADRKPGAEISLAVADMEPGLDVAISGVGEVTLAMREAAAEAARAGGWARVTLDADPVAAAAAPFVRFGSAQVSPPPGGFLQATAEGERVLAEAVLAALPDGAKQVFDLYAGSGAFALRLAERAPVTAVEGDEDATAALRRAADRTPGLKPVETMWRDLVREPMTPGELGEADLVVVDPPRAGAKLQAEALATSGVRRIAMVSCNPATFARDAAILAESGYRTGRVTPVDQFAWTGHVELVAVFERG